MDIEALKSHLKQAKLIIGNVSETVASFAEKYKPAPIGFIAFDLDYYSSTVDSFKLLQAGDDFFLPRVFCYCDDCLGVDAELHSRYTGELLAIEEFNEKNADKKIALIAGLSYKRKFPAYWNEQMFVFHQFRHPLYNTHIHPDKNMQLGLR